MTTSHFGWWEMFTKNFHFQFIFVHFWVRLDNFGMGWVKNSECDVIFARPLGSVSSVPIICCSIYAHNLQRVISRRNAQKTLIWRVLAQRWTIKYGWMSINQTLIQFRLQSFWWRYVHRLFKATLVSVLSELLQSAENQVSCLLSDKW